jgi:hypothetical protein
MKASLKVIACMAVLAVLATVHSASAQGKLEGVWKYSEIVPPAPNAKPIPVREGLLIFTKKHFSMMFIPGVNPRPDLPENATDAQKVAAWEPLNAGSGTYEVKGNTYIAKGIVGKDPGSTQPDLFITVEFKIEGDTLITTPKSTNSGPVNWGSTKLVRVE